MNPPKIVFRYNHSLPRAGVGGGGDDRPIQETWHV